MATSQFPIQIDKLKRLQDFPSSQNANVVRFAKLREKDTLTTSEQEELENLRKVLEPYMYEAEDINLQSDAIEKVQIFFKDNVDGYVKTKQNEMETSKSNAIISINKKYDEFVVYVDGKKIEVNASVADGISKMEDKRNYFVTFVDTKEDEVRSLVQEFDSNTNRYYTSWVAKTGQVDYNIYQGSNQDIPPEANLNIVPENIDLVINGVLMKPYDDYTVHNNGLYDTIRLVGDAQKLISTGTEVVAKWYKNVGKLYFHHASSHSSGGTDPLTVTESMCDSVVKSKLNRVSNPITVGDTAPTKPELNSIWIDTSD